MSNKEKISALMDGESVDLGLISEVENEKDAQQTWQNYHLIGDVMRGDAPDNPNWDIASRVALALEDEPTHSNKVQPMLEEQPAPTTAKKGLPQWLTQFGQVAVAACVSFAVILGVQQYGGSVDGQPSQVAETLPVLQTIPMAGSVEPVSLTRDSMRAKTDANKVSPQDEQIAEQRRRINTVLQDYELQLRLNHSETNSDVETEVK
ncbi:RseA family anti-sigma factor [Vibrio breoganii]|uniref:Anti-sigma-E factor RseA n=2 Tax=Vibrio TaxID=662 RepID=A0AAP8MX11_9VIBR|nr:RseA family anti-sigma factor [Vibrio breoganii]NMO71833.1 anti-sigma E factor [Vibrio breoganii]NMR68371.1 anti-sigma E factor [Vibrio breoganii]OED98315.1 anti-sigma E factor [Vibrio breoganii ZF-29]OEF81162.1 anti-sigma E factor [Vibrio breoganii 1C10]PMG04482.1 anti-sigma E factor [Vibrio breoganii]